MKRIETEILIEADPEKVWSILTDFENHPKWNPFIKAITGEKEIGKTADWHFSNSWKTSKRRGIGRKTSHFYR